MGSTRYIMSIGELTRKDNSLCFRKNEGMYIFQWKTQKKFIALTKWVLTQSCWTFCHRIILSFTFSIIMVDTVGLITQKIII